MEELLDDASLDALERLADEPVPGALTLFVCPFLDVAAEAARSYGRQILGAAAAADISSFQPTGGRWTMDDIEAVRRRMLSQPRVRHVIIVEDADALDQRGFDRLLLLTEEPVAPAVTILCASSPTRVPATLRGRAAAELAVRPVGVAERVERLVRGGATAAAAAAAVELSGSMPSIAGRIAASAEVRALAKRALSPHLEADRPVGSALEKLAAIGDLAATISQPDPAGPVKKAPASTSPEHTARVRSLIGLWVEHRRGAALALLAGGADVGVVAADLRAGEELVTRLKVPVGAALAIGAFAAQTPLPDLTARRGGR